MLDLRSINKNRFTLAKRLWGVSVTLRVLIFVVGVLSVFIPGSSSYIPLFLLLIAAASELFQWHSDLVKGSSESLLRSLDLRDSFQRPISPADKREIVSDLPYKLRNKFSGTEISETYFASATPPGPRKAVENLLESAWYSKRQAMSMIRASISLTALIVAISIIALIVASQEMTDANARQGATKMVSSWLMLLFSLGLVKNAWQYYRMYQRCQKTEMTCEFLLKGDVTEADALKQWYEYQISRSSAPLLPDWLWKRSQSALDDAWGRSSD